MAGRVFEARVEADADEGHIVVSPASFSDMWLLHLLQRRCFAGSQAYGLGTLLVLYLWPRAQILLARSGIRVVGCVIGDVDEGRARILNICVDPHFRRRGIATTLLRDVETRLGASQVTLMVEDKNFGAQELYRRLGYLPVSDLRNYYGRNRHGILMQKQRG